MRLLGGKVRCEEIDGKGCVMSEVNTNPIKDRAAVGAIRCALDLEYLDLWLMRPTEEFFRKQVFDCFLLSNLADRYPTIQHVFDELRGERAGPYSPRMDVILQTWLNHAAAAGLVEPVSPGTYRLK